MFDVTSFIRYLRLYDPLRTQEIRLHFPPQKAKGLVQIESLKPPRSIPIQGKYDEIAGGFEKPLIIKKTLLRSAIMFDHRWTLVRAVPIPVLPFYLLK